MEPEGNSTTVFGTVTYTISDDTIAFSIVPDPLSARITEVQYCDSAEPYTEIGADLCAGIDRQNGDDGPKTQQVVLTQDEATSIYTGTAVYNADEPNWVIHVVINGETTYVVGTEPVVPPFVCDGESEPMTDLNEDGVIDQEDCDYVPPFVCPNETEPMTDDTNDDGTIDADDCTTVADEEEEEEEQPTPPFTCPAGTTLQENGDGMLDEKDCVADVEALTIIGPTTPSSVDEVQTLTIIGPTTPSSVDEVEVQGVLLERGSEDLRSTEVQGVQVAAAAVAPAALARTGANDSTGALVAIAAFLLALGTALVRVGGRRPAAI